MATRGAAPLAVGPCLPLLVIAPAEQLEDQGDQRVGSVLGQKAGHVDRMEPIVVDFDPPRPRPVEAGSECAHGPGREGESRATGRRLDHDVGLGLGMTRVGVEPSLRKVTVWGCLHKPGPDDQMQGGTG